MLGRGLGNRECLSSQACLWRDRERSTCRGVERLIDLVCVPCDVLRGLQAS